MPWSAALVRHPLAVAGAAIATAAGIAFVVLAAAAFSGLFDHPYGGVVVFIVVPFFLVVGLVCIPVGMWLARRRGGPAWASKDWPVIDFRTRRVRRATLLIAVFTIFNLTVVLLAGYGGLHAMESPAFCGAVCHTPMQPQFVAWSEGPHAGTACVACHIGEGPAAFVHAKLAGVRQLVHVMNNSYARPIPPGAAMSPGAQAQTCVGCHRPERAASDRIRIIREYGDDEQSSETTTLLQMRTSAIHWHANPANRVEYAATDATRETIPYVKVTRADGTVREFVAGDGSGGTAPGGTLRTMDCVDCHNTVGHPIAPTAEQAVDRAIAAGLISRGLPHARREGVRLMKASYPSEEEAVGAIDRELRGLYGSHGGAVDERAVARTVRTLQALYRRNVFPSMKVTWGSYPDNRGHLTATGCFRCHDGSHVDKSGQAISVDCESCHLDITVQ